MTNPGSGNSLCKVARKLQRNSISSAALRRRRDALACLARRRKSPVCCDNCLMLSLSTFWLVCYFISNTLSQLNFGGLTNTKKGIHLQCNSSIFSAAPHAVGRARPFSNRQLQKVGQLGSTFCCSSRTADKAADGLCYKAANRSIIISSKS